ncbi:class I SAM-dependent methyltransferase [Tenacibaculum xiamenense]|uniref:class I SAM-dependent methyltransferase n=1 Tax=Tenacibaculum xiamenense TaxID=1261553 RepID=UPI00389411E2
MNDFFDFAAKTYDDTFTNSKVGIEQRKKVYKNLGCIFSSEKRLNILELNCGTGVDAMTFAKNNHSILATDISQEMLKIARERNNDFENVDFEVLDFKDIKDKVFTEPFDVVFSNFGGLNCLPLNELKNLIDSISNLLAPKGKLIMVLMSKKCLWERIYFFSKGKFREAKRRNTNNSLLVDVNGAKVPTWYFNPREIENISEEKFRITNCTPIGIIIPPSYLEDSFLTTPFIWKKLKKLERGFSNSFWAKYADHYLIELTKK